MTQTPRLPLAAAALLRTVARIRPGACWLVGGALRDALIDRPSLDLDLALPQAKEAAAQLAKRWKATCVTLDDKAGTFRLILPGKNATVRHLDFSELQGKTIEEDLGRRDFTANALALPLTPEMSATIHLKDLLDPRGGAEDISQHLLRCENEEILKADPLRILRAFRLAAQLGWTIEPQTLKHLNRLRSRVRRPAAERIAVELIGLLCLPGAGRWVRLMEETGVLTVLFDDLEAARQCALVYYGRGGVLTHTLDVVDRLDFLLDHLSPAFPRSAAPLRQALGEHLRSGNPWRATLMLAALLHDVSKPETARRVGGRLRFFKHELRGAERATAILKALRFPNETVRTVSTVIAQHLRPGNLAAGGPVTDKATYRFFRDLGPEAEALLLVCWADHASYMPQRQLERLLGWASADPDSEASAKARPVEARKTLHHLQVINQLLRRRFEAQSLVAPEKLLDGHAVMRILDLPPGPLVGQVLEKLREAQACSRVKTKTQAVEFVRGLKARLGA